MIGMALGADKYVIRIINKSSFYSMNRRINRISGVYFYLKVGIVLTPNSGGNVQWFALEILENPYVTNSQFPPPRLLLSIL